MGGIQLCGTAKRFKLSLGPLSSLSMPFGCCFFFLVVAPAFLCNVDAAFNRNLKAGVRLTGRTQCIKRKSYRRRTNKTTYIEVYNCNITLYILNI